MRGSSSRSEASRRRSALALLVSLVAGGALASAFIPTFTTLLIQENRDSAWKLASSVANLILLILTMVAAQQRTL